MEAGLRVILAADALTSSSLVVPCQGARHPARPLRRADRGGKRGPDPGGLEMTDALARLQASGRGWNSWASEWPAQMSQLPRGLTLTPVAYASSKNAFTDFPAQGGGVRYGSRVGARRADRAAPVACRHGVRPRLQPAGDRCSSAELVDGEARRVGPALLAVLDSPLATGCERTRDRMELRREVRRAERDAPAPWRRGAGGRSAGAAGDLPCRSGRAAS